MTIRAPSSFSLVLTQVGSTVCGNGIVRLAGTASGNAATLDGESIVESCQWDRHLHAAR